MKAVRQNVDNMYGEVVFRRKLARQHVDGETILPDFCSKQQTDEILRARIQATTDTMAALKARGIRLSPFIELGAERCQRSLAMVNDLDALGFAVDISFDQLRTAKYYSRIFDKPKLPYRVCCDVNHLPFKQASIPFIFCYEFLHHFPSPAPVVHDIFQILSEGYFFFDEEPCRRPRIPLYTQKSKVYSAQYQKKNPVLRFLESFISEEHCDEREHGIIENHDISLDDWVHALSAFDDREITVSSLRGRFRARLGTRVGLRNLPNVLFGGNLRALCKKERKVFTPAAADALSLLTCPECRLRSASGLVGAEPSLVTDSNQLRCEACGTAFPIIDGVMLILPKKLQAKLYPEFCQ
jgi:SAM-dependent methyltransferase/uncharacterized protein YbaR (Trm112 family)